MLRACEDDPLTRAARRDFRPDNRPGNNRATLHACLRDHRRRGGQTDSSVDGLNKLLGVGGRAVAHDARVNFTSDGVRTFGYTSENRLSSAIPAPGSRQADLAYDPLGRLFHILSSETDFRYDGSEIIEETHAFTGAVRSRFVHGPGGGRASGRVRRRGPPLVPRRRQPARSFRLISTSCLHCSPAPETRVGGLTCTLQRCGMPVMAASFPHSFNTARFAVSSSAALAIRFHASGP